MPLDASLFVGSALVLLLLLEALLTRDGLPSHVLAAFRGNSAVALLNLLEPVRAGVPSNRECRGDLDCHIRRRRPGALVRTLANCLCATGGHPNLESVPSSRSAREEHWECPRSVPHISGIVHILKSGCRWCDCAAQSMIYDFRSA
jgi:hypothetical protein